MKNDLEVQSPQITNVTKCPKGNPAIAVCSNQYCKNIAFTCKQQTCECQQIHPLCPQLSLHKMQRIILAHSYSLKSLESKIEDFFYKLIDSLSEKRDQLLKDILKKYCYLGLNKLESHFIEVLKKGKNPNLITCRFIWTLQNELKRQISAQQSLTTLEKQISQIEQESTKEINKISSQLSDLFEKIKENEVFKQEWKDLLTLKQTEKQKKQIKEKKKGIFVRSKIIKKTDDQEKLLAFFTQKKPESAKLLYRASDNEFLTSKFHEKCDDIPNTITIAQTQYGNIIGGFTKHSWFISLGTLFDYQSTNQPEQNFIFSLKNNQKFVLPQESSDHCLRVSSFNGYGPNFGKDSDLFIYNRANENSYSRVNVNSTYKNPKYEESSYEADIKFAGASNFKLTQWQVWKIYFQQ